MPTLFLIRHAEPVEPGSWAGDESVRPLSPRGRLQAAEMGRMLANSGATELLSAPYRRCLETAELIGRQAGLQPCAEQRLHIARRFDIEKPRGVAIWVAHSNNIPGALGRAGIACDACSHGSAWRVDFAENGTIEDAQYFEPAG